MVKKFPFSENCFYCVILTFIVIAVYEWWEGINEALMSTSATGKPRNEGGVV